MSNQKNRNSFKDRLKVNTSTKPVAKPNGNNKTADTPCEKGGQDRTKGGNTR